MNCKLERAFNNQYFNLISKLDDDSFGSEVPTSCADYCFIDKRKKSKTKLIISSPFRRSLGQSSQKVCGKKSFEFEFFNFHLPSVFSVVLYSIAQYTLQEKKSMPLV